MALRALVTPGHLLLALSRTEVSPNQEGIDKAGGESGGRMRNLASRWSRDEIPESSAFLKVCFLSQQLLAAFTTNAR